MIKRVWAKFDGMDVRCVCGHRRLKCKRDSDCKEYVVRFMEINRKQKVKSGLEHLEKEVDSLSKVVQKFENQINKSIKKFKI